jgi:hypothetical protein
MIRLASISLRFYGKPPTLRRIFLYEAPRLFFKGVS